MSKRLKIVFLILFVLFVLLIISDLWSLISIIKGFGIKEGLQTIQPIYELSILVITFFVIKSKKIILPISFILMFYWLITKPIFGVSDEGLKAVRYVYNFFINYSIQPFIMFSTAWLIPVVSLIGCIYWYLDVKQSKSLDKHWSEQIK